LLFLNPSFDRQMIMDEFHLSKESVGAAFAQGSKYKSLPQFVTDLRLEYASKLLVTTDLPIIDIMAKAGFSNASVFSRYFSRKYQISPMQYRRANSEQQ
jgi:AraC-like DNA-binding protein